MQVHRSRTTSFSLININSRPGIRFNHRKTASSLFLKPLLRKTEKITVSVGSAASSRQSTKAVMATTDSVVEVKATATITQTSGGLLSSVVDGVSELVGKTLVLELVSAELDPKTNSEKNTKRANAHRASKKEQEVKCEATFELPADFGKVGAVIIENKGHDEVFVKEIVIDGLSDGPVRLSCDSWIHSKNDNPVNRVFFTDQSYLPSETPSGLKRLREEELEILRGNGEGERKSYERIYDYDVYNDLGNPDSSTDLKRPVLGGKQHPYPRRCRTGRKHSEADPASEESGDFYIPRDEKFGDVKQTQFTSTTISSGLNTIIQSIDTLLTDQNLGFANYGDINEIYKEGYNLPPLQGNSVGLLQRAIPTLLKAVTDSQQVVRFETPEPLKRDTFFWFSDEEFARETLSGVNPYSIELVKEWPLRSTLDPKIYGPPESAITTEVIQEAINGYTVEEAIREKKLFILDYHDLLLPYVSKVREIEGTTLYGSRTIFFLTAQGTLRPLAIELTKPPMDGKPQWKQVFKASCHSTDLWLWRLAKAHVLAHDSGYHELVSHWLRTHCATEPYIIATNRQLSVMHPIYKLLKPHLRYTMAINSLARQALISANGIIEISFSPRKYSMEISSVAYDQLWQFDLQALPKDLISRGMAIEDPNAPHGLKLTIEDYPFANDGLLIWDAIKEWVTDYVSHYYPNSSLVESDNELQAWWTEIRTVGHGDKKDAPWWPKLKTPQDLIEIITNIAWVASAHHAAVNFAQYAYGGYFPNRPSIARNKMPTEDPSKEEWEKFLNKPDQALLESFPTQIQATVVMTILYLLSSHSSDEEYIGQHMEKSWAENPTIKAAFERFSTNLRKIEGIIDSRNSDSNLRNRNGAGTVPYELMKPFSGSGVTGKGVPYSISI